MPTIPQEPSDATIAARNYRILWRWHFYAGLFVMPFLMVLAITGAIYVFKPQIDAALYGDKLFVAASGQPRLGYDKQLAIAAGAVPTEAVATSIAINNDPRRSTEAVFRLASGESTSVYLNPTTGQVLGTLSMEHRFMQQVRQIHRDLLLGKWGRWLMELAACWTLIMVGTGIALWWPTLAAKPFSVWGSLLPRCRLRGRALWRELHLVVGFWVAIGAVFFILSGLPWTSFWGSNFQALVTWANFGAQADHAKKTVKSEHVHGSTATAAPMKMRELPLVDIPWAVGETTVPTSFDRTLPLVRPCPRPTLPLSPPECLTLEQVTAIAARNGMLTYQLALPRTSTDVFTVSYAPGASAFVRSDLDRLRTLHLDQYSGKILKDIRYADYNVVSKAVTLGVALHMGEYFGLANQLLCAAISLALLGMAITGFVMTHRGMTLFGLERRPLHQIHDVLGNLFVVAVPIHVLGVIFESLRHKENLVGAMITGRKRGL